MNKRKFWGYFAAGMTAVILTLFSFSLLEVSRNYSSIYKYPESEDGVLNCQGYQCGEKNQLINLAGEAEFYFDRWAVTDNDMTNPDGVLAAKDGWAKSEDFPEEGYGTYKWTLKNLDSVKKLSFRLGGGGVFVGCRAYFDDGCSGNPTLLVEWGTMSKDEVIYAPGAVEWPRGFFPVKYDSFDLYYEFSYVKNARPCGQALYLQGPLEAVQDSSFLIYAAIGGTAVVIMTITALVLLISSDDRKLALPFFFLSCSLLIDFIFTDFLNIMGPSIGFFIPRPAEIVIDFLTLLLLFACFVNLIARQRKKATKPSFILFWCAIGSSIILFFSFWMSPYSCLWLLPIILFSCYLVYRIVAHPEGEKLNVQLPILLAFIVFLLYAVFDAFDKSYALVYTISGFPSLTLSLMAIFASYLYFRITKNLRLKAREGDHNALLYEKEKNKNLLATVNPHFLFNALTLVESNYHSSLDEGDKAVDLLSKNLRAGIDAANKELIPFDEEMDNVSNFLDYASLRNAKQPDALFDLSYEDFMVPPLSVEIFVENAITHGRLNERKYGRIIVRTRLDNDKIILEVIDNGCGFEPDKVDIASHSGIHNATSRLEIALGAKTHIISSIGHGTTIHVEIPLKKED